MLCQPKLNLLLYMAYPTLHPHKIVSLKMLDYWYLHI